MVTDIPCSSTAVTDYILGSTNTYVASQGLMPEGGSSPPTLETDHGSLPPIEKLDLVSEETTSLTPPPRDPSKVTGDADHRGFRESPRHIVLEA